MFDARAGYRSYDRGASDAYLEIEERDAEHAIVRVLGKWVLSYDPDTHEIVLARDRPMTDHVAERVVVYREKLGEESHG